MDSQNIEILEKAFSKNARVLIWLTDDPLSLETEHLSEIDLFANRVIAKNILSHPTEDRFQTSLFVSQNYKTLSFILHHVFSEEQGSEQIIKNLKSIQDQLDESSGIIILNKSHNTQGINIVKELKRSYPIWDYTTLYL